MTSERRCCTTARRLLGLIAQSDEVRGVETGDQLRGVVTRTVVDDDDLVDLVGNAVHGFGDETVLVGRGDDRRGALLAHQWSSTYMTGAEHPDLGGEEARDEPYEPYERRTADGGRQTIRFLRSRT